MYTCYYDASYYSEQKNGIAGVYIEDEQGECILEKRFPFEGIAVSQQAEAFALKKAIDVLHPYKGKPFRLLGDCKPLIRGIWGDSPSLDYIRDHMQQAGISMSQLVWIYREYNKAHVLTQPTHIKQERPIYEVEVVYNLTEEAYVQYNQYSTKQKSKPFALIEKKLNQHIEEAKYFSVSMENMTVFFRYGFVIFTKDQHIIALYKSDDNRNQYGICKKDPQLLRQMFGSTTVKNQA